MAEENWRIVKKKGVNTNNNWRIRDGSEENKHFSRSGPSRGTPRYQNKLRSSQTSNKHVNVKSDPKIDIKCNKLLNPKILNDLSDNESVEHITAFLISNAESFKQTLASDISEESLTALLKLIAKACENSFVASKSYMLKSTMQSKFISTVCLFLTGLIIDKNRDSKFWDNLGKVLNDLLVILENVLQFIPMTACGYLQTIVKTITLVLPVLQKDKNLTLSDCFEKRITDLEENLNKIKKKFEKSESKIKNNTSLETGQMEPDGDYDGDYQFINIYPNVQELTVPERHHIKRNIVKGEYTSVQQYLDIHFRLMREDFLNPIREDVCDYLNNIKKRFFNIKVHENVVFLKKNIQRKLVCFQVKLEVSQQFQKKIQSGENKKRFMHGTLLFFSIDNFKSLFCGKVVGSDELQNGILHVVIPHNGEIDYTKKYLMIECVIFFEPYYQVLKVLQQFSHAKLPMEKYILKVYTNISYPKYMENVRSLKFPLGLNPSQIKALNAALNQEFVLIQGPPGTGKTFLGITLVKMLLDQKEFWGNLGPMLVICFTNHALEQFISELSKFTDKIVRLGRNSQDLRMANLKYGPERQLEAFLKKKYNLNMEKKYCQFSDSDEEHMDDVKNDNFYLLVSYIKGHVNHPAFDDIPNFEFIRHELPLKITNWLREKKELNDYFANIKMLEHEIDTLKNKLQWIFESEKNGIFKFDYIHNNLQIVDYYFQEIELFYWLLCDDGSTVFRQSNGVEIPKKNSIVEEEKIYNLLSNFVLGRKDYKNCLSVSTLNQAAYELSSYLKCENDLNQIEREYLREQLNFLLQKIDYLKYCLKTDFGPPEIEFNDFVDPFLIQSKCRWQLYKQWIEIYKNDQRQVLEGLYNKYEIACNMYNDLREIDNLKLLREMDIIGMTTTCAARLRSTLESLKSPIVVVEEAAEILESHVVTALTEHCQHLILLGDHQQLRPTTSDYTVEKQYKLGVSLFERMIQNNVECHTLNVQHRMRPEISSLIKPLFYKELFNHKSVENRPVISGIDHPLYFVDHLEPEEPYGDSSKMNVHEAKFLIELAIYLLNNNYKPEKITILAAYLGQSYCLKKEQEKSLHPDLKKIRIAVVDNFQGEENDIILLSLVRSNSDNKVGFLSINNRVCVALSRARNGLYIIGNMTLLCEATEIWKSIRTTLESQNAIGMSLPLRCKNHKEHITLVSKPTDFVKVPQGGCDQSCNAMLVCGHRCVNICHGFDLNHELYNCKQPCSRLLCDDENHKCRKLCFDKCGRCYYLVDRQLPCGHKKALPCSTILSTYDCMELLEVTLHCGHMQKVPCSSDLSKFKCREQIEIQPKCGHKQMIPCFKNVFVENEIEPIQPENKQIGNEVLTTFICKVKTEKVIPKCGHTQIIRCFEDINTYKCPFKMEVTLKCKHQKEKLCFVEEEKITCTAICDQTLPCGHKCPQKCHIGVDPNHRQYKCIALCKRNLTGCNNPEKHRKCTLKCYERCPPCKIIIIKPYTSCSHFEKIACNEAVETRTCKRPCSKKLACGHLCQSKCSESCSICKQTTFKKIPECGHKIKLKCTETPTQKNCKRSCTNILICGHKCTLPCNKPCATVCYNKCKKTLICGHKCIAKCNETCACKIETLPQCGHTIEILCNKRIQDVVCNIKTTKTLLCGHSQLMICSESIVQIKCYNFCDKFLECGHKCKYLCYDACTKECQEQCTKKLECGHPCQNRCSQPCTPPQKCVSPCEKLLKCGHKCQKMCYQPCTEICLEQCEKLIQCGHKCPNTCGSKCVTVCKSKCGKKLQCGHQCNNKCFEECETVCKSICGKELKCGHRCKELCGQPCTQICQRRCQRTLECGHLCKEKCGNQCTTLSQCKNPCKKTLPCGHVDCSNRCNEPCIKCTKKCTKTLNCGHNCINKCFEKCACSMVKSTDCSHFIRVSCGETPTRLDCIYLCNKLLKCGHYCKMLCSEECKCLESCRQRLKCGCLCIKQTCSEPCECRNRCLVDKND